MFFAYGGKARTRQEVCNLSNANDTNRLTSRSTVSNILKKIGRILFTSNIFRTYSKRQKNIIRTKYSYRNNLLKIIAIPITSSVKLFMICESVIILLHDFWKRFVWIVIIADIRMNIWTGIEYYDRILGPYFFEWNLTGERYLDFLRNKLIPVPADIFPNTNSPKLPIEIIWLAYMHVIFASS